MKFYNNMIIFHKIMKISERKSVNCDLKIFDGFAKDSDFIEVTEWTNGEGWDITISDKSFSLTYNELEAIVYLTKYLTINYEANRK